MPRRVGMCSATQTFLEPARADCTFPLAREQLDPRALDQLQLIDTFLASYPRTRPWQRIVAVERAPQHLALVLERFVGVSWHELGDDLRKLGRALPVNVWAALVDHLLEAVPFPLRRDGLLAPCAIGLSLTGSMMLAPAELNSMLDGVVILSGTLISKSVYLSAEQAGGAPTVPQSLVFVCAAIAQRLLTGRAPFGGDSDLEFLRKVQRGEATPIEHPQTTRVLEAFFKRCFDPRAEARWSDVAAMRAGLRDAVPDMVSRQHAFGLVLGATEPRRRTLLNELRVQPGLLPPVWEGVYPAGSKPLEGLAVFEDRLLELQRPVSELLTSIERPMRAPFSPRINIVSTPEPTLLRRVLGWLGR